VKIALDTNVVVYAEGVARSSDDAPKIAAARRIVEHFANDIVVPIQVLGELVKVCLKHPSVPDIADRLEAWASVPNPSTRIEDIRAALALQHDYGTQWFDALIIAVSARHGCTVLLSEDVPGASSAMPIRIINPFTDTGRDFLGGLGLT